VSADSTGSRRLPSRTRAAASGVLVAVFATVSLACGPDGPDAGEFATRTDVQGSAPVDTAVGPVAESAPLDAALVAAGREVALGSSCAGCHAADFGGATGPSWIGLADSRVLLTGGREVTADEAYLRRAIVEPGADVVDGYIVKMPAVALDDAEIDALVAFIRSLGSRAE